MKGKGQGSRETSCELNLQWKLILSLSFCPYPWKNRTGWMRRRGPWLRIARVLEARTSSLVPQVRAVRVRCLCLTPDSKWQKESRGRRCQWSQQGHRWELPAEASGMPATTLLRDAALITYYEPMGPDWTPWPRGCCRRCLPVPIPLRAKGMLREVTGLGNHTRPPKHL